jgi:endonuclease/exonuclease/phosphatase family metal-dependent hydrolase
MKIVTWNCQGSFRTKAEHMARLKPDIAIIQECEALDRLTKLGTVWQPAQSWWHGDLRYKGVGIFAFNRTTFIVREPLSTAVRYCLPIHVQGAMTFNVLAIWAMATKQKETSYIGQVYQGVQLYEGFLTEREAVVVGDLNSNTQWDAERRIGNHSAVVRFLDERGLVSAYHSHYNEVQGAETQPTFYLQRNQSKPYHIDYCFVPQSWTDRLHHVTVGRYSEWHHLSDHCPLIVEVAE